MQYPNRVQAALLFDRPVDDLEAIMRSFMRIEGMRSGAQFHLSGDKPGQFYHLYASEEELTVTFEYCDRPAAADLFRPALSSPYTGLVTPDIRDRITRCDTHILCEVSHGVFAGVEEDPKIAAMFEQIGRPRAGATQPQFARRLSVLALMARIASEQVMPLAVHWTQSDLLLHGEAFDRFAAIADVPGPLHIHPFLFGPTPAPGEDALAGIRTFGARHWIGREIIIQPNVLPWAANFEAILAFLRVATTADGYIIPDGDTFGPEDRSQSYRVLHHEAGANINYHAEAASAPERADIPLIELVPLKYLEFGFVAPEHVPEGNVFDDRAFPADIMPADQEAKVALANEWAEKRKLAEGIGGRFEVRQTAPSAPPNPPSGGMAASGPRLPGRPGVGGLRSRVFGRKGT